MNKILNYIRYITFLITLIFTILFSIKNGINYDKILLLYISLIILLIINIRDIKFKREFSNRYNILYIFAMLFTSFILFRSIFDTNIISNSKYYIDIINSIQQNTNFNLEYGEYGGVLYLSQNVYYLLILYLCLIIYHQIDAKNILKVKNTFRIIPISCLIVSIFLFSNTHNLLVEKFDINHFPLLFFTANIILLVVEISSLINDHSFKRKWMIYLSFLFNYFCLVAILT